jgi:hypothetical protein
LIFRVFSEAKLSVVVLKSGCYRPKGGAYFLIWPIFSVKP